MEVYIMNKIIKARQYVEDCKDLYTESNIRYTDEELDEFEAKCCFNLDVIYEGVIKKIAKGPILDKESKLYAYCRRRFLKEKHLIK